ncbi:MAG TPA: FimV/HubP family polar landmark protein [Nevskiaceae bacterium]|nr:FimV/HubP family polar landmark protein [Nevskiaceae bacterium]
MLLALALDARAQERSYGPVKRDESLTTVARRVRPEDTRLATMQTLVALFRANPDAFDDGDINRLKPGSVLIVPDAKTIRAIPERETHGVFELRVSGPENTPPHPAQASYKKSTDIQNDKQLITAQKAVRFDEKTLQRIPEGHAEAPLPPAPPPLPDPNRASGLAPVPPPQAWSPDDAAPIPDRWRLLDTLGITHPRWYDPYHSNVLKGDKPLDAAHHFFVLSVISDSVYEARQLPTPVGPQATTSAGANDIFGGGTQTLFNQNLIVSLVYLEGDTTFQPPDFELHATPVFNFNDTQVDEERALKIDPRAGNRRADGYLGVQELFVDYHLRNVSDRYDFDSIRFGIQPISLDFRGFLLQDDQLALRLFGNRDNNRWQYNLGWMRRLEKNSNSGLNAIDRRLRVDDTFFANLYRQDFPVMGFTSQGVIAANLNREEGHRFYDDNGFLERPASFGTEQPRRYHVTYLGYNGDGHFGRINLTTSLYAALGRESRGVFSASARDIAAGFGAAEISFDQDWVRWKLSLLWASGDHDPYDGTANGFDAIFENPIFAGADTSFYIRQAIPLIGGGGVALSMRNGVLNDLRTSKEHGQSNFTNAGTQLAGVGADFDLMPQLRLSTNFNYLRFDQVAVLELARNQGGISRNIGLDLSGALIWRPWFSQNIVARLSAARLLPGAGFRDLFPEGQPYSLLGNLILTY